MKLSTLIAAVAITLFLLPGCETAKKTQKTMDSWMGAKANDLIKSWGPPQQTTSDGDGGKVLIYYQTTYSAYTRVTTYHYKMFYVSEANIIYHWKTDYSNVAPQQIDVIIR